MSRFCRINTGIKVVHVPTRARGRPRRGLLSGDESDLLFVNPGVFMPHLKSGKLRALGFGIRSVCPCCPRCPRSSESGYPGFESSNFKGLLAPAGTPRAVIDKLHAELVKIVHAPDTVARMTAAGSIPVGNTPEQFGTYIKQEIARYAKLVKVYGIKGD